MGDDKEIELLAIFLNVKISVPSEFALVKKEMEMDMEPLPTDPERGILSRYYRCCSEYEALIGNSSTEIAFNLLPVTQVSNFQKFYDEYFHRKCCICSNLGILAMCLFCGEAACCIYCGPKSFKVQNFEAHCSLI